MADDLLPLLGHGLAELEEDGSSSESDTDGNGDPADQDVDQQEQSGRSPASKTDGSGNGRSGQITYDKSLPGIHSYLGDDLEEIRGRTVYEDDAVVTMPLLALPGVVLVPGQVIPLHLFQQQLVATLRRLAETDKTFGVVTYRIDPEEHASDIAQIGCTAEIFSMKNETDDATGISTLRAKARGRQRFRILDMHREVTGILTAKVRILPEMHMPPVLSSARPLSHCKLCCSPPENMVVKTAVDRQGRVIAAVNMLVNRQVERFSCAYLTQWPPWVYKMYDEELLRKRVLQELQSWNQTFQSTCLPQKPTDLSYWVAQNLPLDDSMRMHLLGVNCTVHRLRSEIAIMKKCAVLCCASCYRQIAQKKDVFSMSEEGPLSAYVNPGGHVHETLTCHDATNLSLIGRPSTEHSWFPGFAWTIAQCRSCHSHMGWRFTATKKSLSPQKFWGLCRSSLVPDLRRNTENEEEVLVLEG